LTGADESYSVWVDGDAAAAEAEAKRARIHYLNYEAQSLTADEFNELIELLREAA
jgi:hypothetical protein